MNQIKNKRPFCSLNTKGRTFDVYVQVTQVISNQEQGTEIGAVKQKCKNKSGRGFRSGKPKMYKITETNLGCIMGGSMFNQKDQIQPTQPKFK